MVIFQNFGEDAHGRDGHGHASKSKETMYEKKNFFFEVSIFTHQSKAQIKLLQKM